MHQTVENCISQRRVADGLMPMFDGQLAGDDGRTGTVPVIKDFKQVAAAFVREWRQSPVINQQHLSLGQLCQRLGVTGSCL